MFARWRNLAAAAGAALCFPVAFAQAAAHRDDSQSNPPSICAESQDFRRTAGCFGCEYDHWHDRYYRNALDEYGSVGDELAIPGTYPSLSDETTNGGDDDFTVKLSFEELEDIQGDEMPIVIDSEGRCNDPTCPCHDSFDSFPSVQLTGTIEPESDEFDGDRMDGLMLDDQEITLGSAIGAVEQTGSTEEDLTTGTADEFAQSSDEDLSNQTPRFHMFYPGCDWTPYYPVDSHPETKSRGEPLENELPACFHLAQVRESFPFHGAVWMWQSTFSLVTWTGKLAEQFHKLVNQTGAYFSASGMASDPFAQ